MRHVLTIEPDGNLACLYTEAIPLEQIGALTVNRLTEIEFNNVSHLWEIKDMDGKVLFTNRSRQRCLKWEHRHYNH